MGPQQIGLLELYARRASGRPTTAFTHMANRGSVGLSMNDPMGGTVVDSAGSATQLATGQPARNGTIGIGARGEPHQTILEAAEAAGKATGLVSDTRLTHATPAAFAAHVPHRSMEDPIAEQLLTAGAEVLLSGGRRHWTPRSADGTGREDGRDLLGVAEEAGYVVVQDRASLREAGPGRLLGLFARSGMMDAIAERTTRDEPDRTEPSLNELAEVALKRLSTDEDGFFLMIEAGQIDWACHANDAGWLLAEMRRAEELIRAVVDWAEDRGDTLVVVTADHETGGFGISNHRVQAAPTPEDDDSRASAWSYGRLESLEGLAAQRATWTSVIDDLDELPEADRTADALRERVEATSVFVLDREGAQRVLATTDLGPYYRSGKGLRAVRIGLELAPAQDVVWSTGTHTHTPVPVFAIGPGHGAFAGMHHHTGLGRLLMGLVSAE
jgi:alkaline phosphatase